MKLIVISPETTDPREPIILAELFAAGLTDYHLRKPAWTRDQLSDFLRALPADLHPRIILHTHHDLAADFPVAGLHHRSGTAIPACATSSVRSLPIHDLPTLRASLDQDGTRLLFSPVFPSISKPDHTPRHSTDELRAVLRLPRRAELIALGGIDAEHIPDCRALGFDGVAVLGAIWRSPDPVAAYRFLREIATFA